MASLANKLIGQAQKSFPVVERLRARTVYLMDGSQHSSLAIEVFVSYRGRSLLAHTFTMTYSESASEAMTT